MTQKKTDKKPVSRKKRIPSQGDTITIRGVGFGAAVAAGRNASASVVSGTDKLPEKWLSDIRARIDALENVSREEKQDIKGQVQKIDEEIQKGQGAERSRLEKLINTLSVMAPDIFEVVVATLQSPLAGIGIIVKKVGDKVRLGSSAK